MKRTSLTVVLALSLSLLGLAAGLYRLHFPPGPVADEAAYLMLTQSLWHDRDLRYDPVDLQRAYQVWDQGPYGLILLTRDGGETMFYGKPFIYPLVAAPFYGLFGAQGPMILNMLLYLGMFWTGWFLLRRWPRRGTGDEGDEDGDGPDGAAGDRGAGLLIVGAFFGAVTFAYVFWIHPEVFNMACVFFALAIWQWVRRRPDWTTLEPVLLAVAGLLIAAAFSSKEILVLLGLPIGIDLLWGRRFKGAFAFAAAAALGALLLVGIQWQETGTWSPYRDAQRRSFDKAFPHEDGEDFWALYRGTSFGSWSGAGVEATPEVLVQDIQYFFVGRHVGLLPYFPFALYLGALYLLGPRDRSRHLLLLAIVGYCLVVLLIRPHNFHGGAGFLGNRYFASLYPALLFLPGRLRAGKAVLLPFAAAGLFTLPVIFTPVQQVAPEFGLQVHARQAPFTKLPLELTLLPQGRIPGWLARDWGQGLWVVPRQNFLTGENHPDGVWVRGGSRSEVYVVSPVELETVRFTAQSISAENVLTVESGGESLAVRFDSEAKRAGTPLEIRPEKVAEDLSTFFTTTPREHIYRLVLTTTDGVMPARRDPQSQDERYLGVFLSFQD